jgi:hypothetical protein
MIDGRENPFVLPSTHLWINTAAQNPRDALCHFAPINEPGHVGAHVVPAGRFWPHGLKKP